MTQDETVEMERATLIATECEAMVAEGLPIAHDVLWARLEEKFPGFSYTIEEDGQYIPAQMSAVGTTGEMAAPEPGDTVEVQEPEDVEALRRANAAEDVEALRRANAAEDVEAIRRAHAALSDRAGELRAALFIAGEKRAACRAVLAECIRALQNGMPKMDDAALRREFLAASIAEREAAKETGRSRVPDGAFGRSAIDRAAAYGRGNDATAFLQKQMVSGFRRGGSTLRRLPSSRG